VAVTGVLPAAAARALMVATIGVDAARMRENGRRANQRADDEREAEKERTHL
jgi:hypothetical protein